MKIQIWFFVVVLYTLYIYIYIYVFSSLLQISKFKEESNLKLRHVNQPLKKELSMWTWQKKIWTRFYGQWVKLNIQPWKYAMNRTYISDGKERNKEKVWD